MDIERLHKNLERDGGRRFGRTYTNIVLALHEADFSDGTVLVTAYNKSYAESLIKLAYSVANKMKFEYVRMVKKNELLVNGTKYIFTDRSTTRRRGTNALEFADHFNASFDC